ncbi:MAG: hypothetical protein H8D46_02840 [FCB group bacterium]|nr:hypothetical protein [FCB group bacterium]
MEKLKSLNTGNKIFELKVKNVDKTSSGFPQKRCHITPATWVNGKFWYAGDFDSNEFIAKIKTIMSLKETA